MPEAEIDKAGNLIEESVIQKLKKKLEDDFVYYSNATISWAAPYLVSKRNYAHELLEWLKEQLPEKDNDIRGKTDEAE